jgi:hypothetical protein
MNLHKSFILRKRRWDAIVLTRIESFMPDIIGSVTITPPIPRPGQSVLVEVRGHDGVLLNPATSNVTIAGVPGAAQYLQFPKAGPRTLGVNASGTEGDEFQTLHFNVEGEPITYTGKQGRAELAMLAVTQSQTSPYSAVITLGSPSDTRAVARLRQPSPVRSALHFVGAKNLARRAKPSAALERLIADTADIAIETRDGASDSMTFVADGVDVAQWRTLLGTRERTFTWDFGDGTKAQTDSPVISHDYFAAMDHRTGVGTFHVSVHVTPDEVDVRRTLTIYSAYTLSKRSGMIVPHVVGELFAHKKFSRFAGSFIAHNVEDVSLVLDRMSVTPITDDAEAATLPGPFRTLAEPIVVPPHGATSIGVNVPFTDDVLGSHELPHDIHGFTVIYAGIAGDVPVRCSFTFDVPVEEWDDRPHLPKIPELPPLHRESWPWDLVKDWWREELSGVDEVIDFGGISLDAVTGTVAIPLEDLATSTTLRAERTIDIVLDGVYAPVQARALAAGVAVGPITRRLTSRLAPYADTNEVASGYGNRKDSQRPGSGFKGARSDLLERPGTSLRDRRVDQDLMGAPMLARVRPVADMFANRTFHTLEGNLPGPPKPGVITEGNVCDPDNLTEAELTLAQDGQLVCQLTDEAVDVLMPARWMNARRGDVILSPGGDGIIGGLMLRVSPPQLYSHSGIMTRNFDEIAHSTGSQDRLMDHRVGLISDGSDGFDPEVLKWMWPGAIRQSVQCSVEGEDFPDPEYPGKTYRISAFGRQTIGITHNDQMVMIPPLVLKPDPLQETPQVRATLHAIADAARADSGTPGVRGAYHYRFFCYTDPTIGLDDNHGPESGWAVGTRPSVCSSFIWMKARDLVSLEGPNELLTPSDLEAGDVTAGASVNPETIDGLYRYTASERLAAGEWLYEHIYDMAHDQAGWFGTFLTGAPDDVANQFLNVFASDNAEGKDSEAWRATQDANAVSPDDMMWWDGPSKGSVYGYVEPAIYREPRVETYTVSRWKKVLTRGLVHGRVLANGAPVGGAAVSLYGDKTGLSRADGSFSIPDVPLGDYLLKASKVVNGTLHSLELPIQLSGPDLSIDVILQPPDERFRLAQVFVDFRGVDEENYGDNEVHDPGPEYFELELGPSKLNSSLTRTYKWGGEVRATYNITTKLLVGNIVDVVVVGRLYEGTSEDTDDLDGQGAVSFQVPPGATGGGVLRLTNTDEDDDDEGRLSISVSNARNDN